MNRQLLAFLTAQLAAHRRVNRYTDDLVSVIVGDRQYAVEGCTCGFEIQRPGDPTRCSTERPKNSPRRDRP